MTGPPTRRWSSASGAAGATAAVRSSRSPRAASRCASRGARGEHSSPCAGPRRAPPVPSVRPTASGSASGFGSARSCPTCRRARCGIVGTPRCRTRRPVPAGWMDPPGSTRISRTPTASWRAWCGAACWCATRLSTTSCEAGTIPARSDPRSDTSGAPLGSRIARCCRSNGRGVRCSCCATAPRSSTWCTRPATSISPT